LKTDSDVNSQFIIDKADCFGRRDVHVLKFGLKFLGVFTPKRPLLKTLPISISVFL